MKRIGIFLVALLLPCLAWAIQGGPKNATVKNLTLTNSGQEYSATIPNGTSGFTIQSRTAADFKMAFAPNTSGFNYFTVKSGSVYNEHNLDLDATNFSPFTTAYFQSTTGGQVLEMIIYQ